MSKRLWSSLRGNGGWAWKPPYAVESNLPHRRRTYKQELARARKKAKRLSKRLAKLEGKKQPHPFYDSERWRNLRYRILRRDGARCVVCGRGYKQGVILHVDHIKPRSLYPALEWSEDNLQVLCADCNLGKSNTDTRDWR